ncbi:MAG: Holliday junction resolvase RuvX [Rickettsiales bacterium]|nr:Holliday junction resolvase RuvX [Rickettsiales bacterium]|tara:strand:+ start:100 stop:558 length:459 start_codon:yes stop_codon:yes gene_type:complete
MLCKSLEEFTNQLPPKGRLLALDLGSKTIGLALSDELRGIANALHTIKRRKFSQDIDALQQAVKEHAIAGLVMGYPLNMDGSEGPRCQSTRQFVRNMEEHISLPTLLWDERLSSYAAEEAMLSADLSREKRAEKIDKLAAAIILQGLLEHIN